MSLSSEICGQLYELAKNENGRNVELTLNEVSVLLIQNREDADYVLRRNVGNYRKNMSWFRKVLGASRFSEDGKEWEARRDLTQPYLNKFDRQQTFALSATYARQALAKMIAHSQAGAQTIDDRVLREMTASVLVENFFGIPFSQTGVDLGLLAELIEFGSEYAFVPAGKTKDLYQDRLAALPELRRRVLANLSIFRSGKLPANPMLEGMLAADADPSSSFVFEHELITFLAAGADVMGYLNKRAWSNDTVNKLMAWMTDNQASGDDGAKHFLKENEALWKEWVSPEAAEKIKAAL